MKKLKIHALASRRLKSMGYQVEHVVLINTTHHKSIWEIIDTINHEVLHYCIDISQKKISDKKHHFIIDKLLADWY